MFHLMRNRSLPKLLRNDLPTLIVAAGVAGMFYKFHNFLLELVAFMVTWYALGFLVWMTVERRRETPAVE